MNEHANPEKAAPKRPSGGGKWPLIVVGLLLLNVGVCVVTIIAATSHPIIVEPDYYDKALRWDELHQLASAAENAQLVVVASEDGVVTLILTEAEGGGALVPAGLSAVAVHESMPGQEIPVDLISTGDGRYESVSPLPEAAGLAGAVGGWTVRARVTLDESLPPVELSAAVEVPQ